MNAEPDIASCNWQDDGGVQLAASICAFLERIGIPVTVAKIDQTTLLTGMTISKGGVLVDSETPCWVGDLLHEAGHIAVTEPERRASLNKVGDDPAEEMATIAWSVAAARACNIPLDILFHSEGYKGGSQSLIDAFSTGTGPGIPMIVWYGMAEQGAFPEMKRWLR